MPPPRALLLEGSRRGSSTVTSPSQGCGFMLALRGYWRAWARSALGGPLALSVIMALRLGLWVPCGTCLPPWAKARLHRPVPPPPRLPLSLALSLPSPPSRRGPPPGSSLFSALCGLGWGLASGGGSGLWSLLPAFPRLPVRAHTCHAAIRAGLAVHLLAVVSFSASCAPSRELLPPICVLT